MYTGKKRGALVEGEFKYGPIPVRPGEVFYDENFDGTVRSGIHFAKCVMATSCQFQGTFPNTGTFNYSPEGNVYDTFLATISGKKWKRIATVWQTPRPTYSITDFIDDNFQPNEYIRDFCRRYVPAPYLDYYDGCYVNVSMTPAGFSKLITKMEGIRSPDGTVFYEWNWSLSDKLEVMLLFLKTLRWEEIDFPIDLSEEVVFHEYTRAGASLGFQAFYEIMKGTKANIRLALKQWITWFFHMLIDKNQRAADVAPYPAYVMATKAEVRGPDVDRDKVRKLFTNNAFTDFIKEIFMRPMYNWSKLLPEYLGGVNFSRCFVPRLLLGLHHPLARTWYPECDVYTGPCALICLDLGSQDDSYRPWIKHFLSELICLPLGGKLLDHDFLLDLASYVISSEDVMPVNMPGDNWFIKTAVMATGDKFTAIMNFFMAMFNLIATYKSLAPTWYLRAFKWSFKVLFGDDTTLRVPVPLARQLFGDDLTNFSKTAYANVGVNYKISDSAIYYPTKDHLDRTFTWVDENDEIKSPGLFMLKHRLVKIDSEGNKLHPDSTQFHAIVPWRPTSDIVSKFALDPENWKSESSPSKKWFMKNFGLLMAACSNRVAHNMLKNACNAMREEEPSQWEDAVCNLDEDSTLYDFRKKYTEFNSNLMSKIYDHPDSFKIVLSGFLPRKIDIRNSFPKFYNCPSRDDLP